MTNLSKKFIVALSVSLAMFPIFSLPKSASADCKVTMKLEQYTDGATKPTHVYATGATVNVGKDDKYRLTYNINQCLPATPPVKYQYKLEFSQGGASLQPILGWTDFSDTGAKGFNNFTDLENSVSLDTKYQYMITTHRVTDVKEEFVSLGSLSVTFKDPGGISTPVNANANTGNPNSAINTSTGADFSGTNYDESLGNLFNPLTKNSLPEILAGFVRILFVLTGLAAVIVIILAGFRMVVDNGNETQVANAKKAITWAVMGLIVSILAFSIVAIIQKVIQS